MGELGDTFHRLVLVLLVFSEIHCQSDIDDICQERAHEGLDYLSYPDDCNSFIYCEDPAYLGNCAEGYYFDEANQVCDEQENVQCGSEPTTPETTTITTSTTTTTTEDPTTTTTTPMSTTTISTTSTTDEILVPDNTDLTSSTTSTTAAPVTTTMTTETPSPKQCPQENGNGVFIPSETSCMDYYFCFNNIPMLMHCANNLHFNPAKGKCDFKEHVHCAASKPTCDKNVDDFFPHESSCNFFYYCSGGYLSLQQCPYFYHWDVEVKECRIKFDQSC